MGPRILIVDDNAELLGLLSTVFENAGYTVIQAQRARQAMERARADKPDMAVVDVLLPDLIGYEVAAQLRSLKIPFVLISGVFKGGRHAMEAGAKHGALDYFEKPFEIERLVERVASVVPANRSQVRVEETTQEIELAEIDEEAEDDAQPLELTGQVSVTESAGNISATLRGESIRVEPARRLPPRAPEPPRTPVTAATPAAPPVVATPPPPAVAPPGSRIGQLKDNFPQLISAFYLAQETGELVLQRGAVRKVVYFEKGAPVFAVSNLATDRLGQFLVRTGKVQPEEFQAAVVVADRTNRRTGDVLIEMGLLSETERMYYIGQQVKAIIYSLFAWEEGSWLLAFKRRARHETLKLDLHPANLILRGVKKLYTPGRLTRLLPDDALPIPAQDPSYLLSDIEFESWEATLLSRVDGTRNTRQLIELARRPPEQVRGLLVGLLSLRILELAR
jgi:CheY-like chemotaxis protein